MAKAVLKSIEDLKDKDFYICAYQRGYRWDKNQMLELLGDLFEFTRMPREGDREPDYCLQPIIVKQRNDGSYELVDGQQRLTALWLIIQFYSSVIREPFESYYSLTYEKKDNFSKLITDISKKTKEEFDAKNVYDAFSARNRESLDSCMLLESMEALINCHIGTNNMFTIIPAIVSNLNRIKIIWYELEDESPVEIFANVNANKIRLTNAELIKAVLLRNINLSQDKRDFANEWENIEKKLNNDELWYFISGNKGYVTRIDLLFYIWCEVRRNLWGDISTEQQYFAFRIVSEIVTPQNALATWEQIKKISESITDWYNNYKLYHLIGLLTLLPAKDTVSKNIEIIKDLYVKYDSMTKTDFEKYVVEELKKYYIGTKKKHIAASADEDSIRNKFRIMVYDDDGIKEDLLLYNIALLVNAGNEYERFPFSLYKSLKYDKEHINPRTPSNDTETADANRKEWLSSYRVAIEEQNQHPDLIGKIDACLANSLDGFDELAAEIVNVLDVADNDSIGNLVLLDQNTNRGYKNACFNDKRKKIIDIERVKAVSEEDEKYIPVGTKWVFLKGYENADNFKIWSVNDRTDYINDMAKQISILFGGN